MSEKKEFDFKELAQMDIKDLFDQFEIDMDRMLGL